MAASRDSRKERFKCSGITLKGPPIGTGMWLFITVWCLFGLQSVDCQNCMSINMTVATYPQGDINIPFGNPLEIYCTTENYTSSKLKFLVNNTAIAKGTSIVNSTTIRLYVEQPPRQRITYYCRNTVTNKNCLNKVLIDSPPKDVTDFRCISDSLESLNCSWSASNKSFSDIRYNLTFDVTGQQLNCNLERIYNTWFCFLSTTTQPRYRQNLPKYIFNLISCNIFGCNKQNITIDHFAIIKPKQLKISHTILSPHRVLLSWSIPNSLVDYLKCGLDHKIEYQIAKIDDPKHFRVINATWLPPINKTYKFELALPYAFMSYEVRIYSKSKKAGDDLWSDFKHDIFQMDSEIPHRPPDMPAGAFFITPYSNRSSRAMYIYWKQLEEYEECGANFTYEIQINQENRSQILSPNKSKSLSYVVLSDTTTEALEVSVKSKNAKGTSENSSHLFIPPKSRILEGSTSFTKLAFANGTYELSWDINIKDLNKIDNYTLFWCRYNWTQVCVGRMNYTILEPHKKNHIIDLPSDQRYQFAISVNSGVHTTGMVWAKCDIFKDAANYDIPVRLNHDSPINSSVVIRWTMECTLRDGIVIGYKITYCATVKAKDECDNNVGNKTIDINDPNTRYVNITDLLYYTTYKFGFVLVTAKGLIPNKDATTFVTTPEGTPSSPVNITISDIKHDSVVISYDPPVMKNGHIMVYVIYNYGEIVYNDTTNIPNEPDNRRSVRISNLKGFTQYSWTVLACNKYCSYNTTEPIVMRTSIGPPSKLGPPTTKHNPDILEWQALNETEIAGNIWETLYQIQKVKNKDVEIYNISRNTFSTFGSCEGVINYRVRAINFDIDIHHGARSESKSVLLPMRDEEDIAKKLEYPGEWSDPYTMDCRHTPTVTMILQFTFLFLLLTAMVFGFFKFYRVRKDRKDIDGKLPEGMIVLDPADTPNKYSFPKWNPVRKEDKPSEEKSLISYSKPILPPPEIKVKDEHSGASDHTDSTILSEASRGPVEREASTSDEGSNCSLDLEPIKSAERSDSQEEETSSSDATSTPDQSPLFRSQSPLNFKKNLATGYVTAVTKSQPTAKPQPTPKPQPTTSSYVMASLDPPIYTRGEAPTLPLNRSGYVSAEDMQSKSFMNFPKLGASPTKPFGPDSLPILPNLPSLKHDAGSYPLQNLDTLPSVKAAVRNVAQPKVTPGYVSPDNAVVTKHLNILSSNNQGGDDPAILDPTVMSPDAYCRFSWNVNPSNDNLNALHADSPNNQSSTN